MPARTAKKTNDKPGQTQLRSLSGRVSKIEKLLWEVADFNASLVEGIRGYEEAIGGFICSRKEWSQPLLRFYQEEERKEMAKARAKPKMEQGVGHGS